MSFFAAIAPRSIHVSSSSRWLAALAQRSRAAGPGSFASSPCSRRGFSVATAASSSSRSSSRKTALVAAMGAVAVAINYTNNSTTNSSGVMALGALPCNVQQTLISSSEQADNNVIPDADDCIVPTYTIMTTSSTQPTKQQQ